MVSGFVLSGLLGLNIAMLRMYIFFFLIDGYRYLYMVIKTCLFYFSFCLLNLSRIERSMLKSTTIIVDVFNSPYGILNALPLYFEAMLLRT